MVFELELEGLLKGSGPSDIWVAAALADKLPFWLLPIFLFCQSITDFEVLKVVLHLSTVIHSYADFIN